MASARNERKTFQKDGPKRRRFTRRELPEGGYTQWMSVTNFKREREAAKLRADDRDQEIR
jgi:hypothetical protein